MTTKPPNHQMGASVLGHVVTKDNESVSLFRQLLKLYYAFQPPEGLVKYGSDLLGLGGT